jgi:hypothetical protein
MKSNRQLHFDEGKLADLIHPPISQEKAGFITYSYYKVSESMQYHLSQLPFESFVGVLYSTNFYKVHRNNSICYAMSRQSQL